MIAGLTCSCTVLTPMKSKRVVMSKVKDTPDFCNYFNADTKIRYGFGNDDSLFYLKLEALDDDVANMIIVNGLKIYFDVTDKTQKDIYMNFPMKSQPETKGNIKAGFQPREQMEGKEIGFKPMGEMNHSGKADVELMVSETAIWSVFDDLYPFNWRLQKAPFNVNISKGNIDQLVYEAFIPIDQIIQYADDSSFTLGIEVLGSGKASMGNDEKNGSMGAPGGGMSGGPGGGMPGGMGGGPGGGMHGGNGGAPDKANGGSSDPQIFWVLVDLQK